MKKMISSNKKNPFKLIVIDPAHFHAALLQKNMYKQISSVVHIYAAVKDDINDYLNYISEFNNRLDNPTSWQTKVYSGYDFLEKMAEEKAGSITILAGNNKKRIQYIQKAVSAGINILADKPLCINKSDFKLLKTVFSIAEDKSVLLYDIMTERSEITNILQKELCNNSGLFGELIRGTAEQPAIIKGSVHHFYKSVNNIPIIRPEWYFDIRQTGEGIVDVTSHLIDLAHWTCFPGQIIDYHKDIKIVNADHWPTEIDKPQFKKVTQKDNFPVFLQPYLKNDILNIYANGYIIYTLKGYHIKVKIEWNYEAEQGKGDRHYSVIKGTKANIIIRQGNTAMPELYVEAPQGQSADQLRNPLRRVISSLQASYPGLDFEKEVNQWRIIIPAKYRTSHEAHFTDVVERYLQYLIDGKLPDWEIPNMLSKYFITTSALELINKKS